MSDPRDDPTRQTRRQRAEHSRRIQGDTGGEARNFNCAAPPGIGGDCLIAPPKTAQSNTNNPTNAPQLRRDAERLRRGGYRVAQIADVLRVTLPTAARLIADDMDPPCRGCPMRTLCRTTRVACSSVSEWADSGRYDPDALRRPTAAIYNALPIGRTSK
jgi:hypothetical protein